MRNKRKINLEMIDDKPNISRLAEYFAKKYKERGIEDETA